MRSLIRNFIFRFINTPIGLIASLVYRIFREAIRDTSRFIQKILAILRSREFVNFTYHLNEQSRAVLPHTIMNIAGCTFSAAEAVILELEQDRDLAAYYALEIRRSDRKWASDSEFKPGRLLLHYALVRLTKPRCVFEAGLDKGHGAIVINKALARNREEGFDARYIGVEYRADRPAFLLENYPDRIGSPIYASWSEVMESLAENSIDFLFYDAVTYPDHIEKLVEFSNRMSPNGLLVCAWAHPEILAIAERIRRNVSVFSCSPKAHWEEGNNLSVFHADQQHVLKYQ